MQQVEGLAGGEDGGTYFVDQSGQYYYQASSDDAPVMTQVQIQEAEDGEIQNEGDEAGDEQYHEIEELDNVEGAEEAGKQVRLRRTKTRCNSANSTIKKISGSGIDQRKQPDGDKFRRRVSDRYDSSVRYKPGRS